MQYSTVCQLPIKYVPHWIILCVKLDTSSDSVVTSAGFGNNEVVNVINVSNISYYFYLFIILYIYLLIYFLEYRKMYTKEFNQENLHFRISQCPTFQCPHVPAGTEAVTLGRLRLFLRAASLSLYL